MKKINYQLNDRQKEAADHLNGPMLVLAGPGSGKTHLLVERLLVMIEQKGVSPEDILVITFSKKAALSMQDRFLNRVNYVHYPVTFGTFHAVFYHIIKSHKHKSYNNVLLDNQKRQIIEEIASKNGVNDSYLKSVQDEVLNYISFYKNHNISLVEYAKSIDTEYDFVNIYYEYNNYCKNNELIDFDDMIMLCDELFENEAILSKWQDRYKYILIDEFQDVNIRQYNVIKKLAGSNANLFCVGDDDQSIYAFRGSYSKLMQQLFEDYPQTKLINLNMNYRCNSIIIEFADRLIRKNDDRIERDIQQSSNIYHKLSDDDSVVNIVDCDSSISEAEYICGLINCWVNDLGYKRKDIAVLYRSNFAASVLKEQLELHKIPYYSNEKSIDFYSIKEISVVISFLKCALGVFEKKDLFVVINHPEKSFSREAFSSAQDIEGDNFIRYLYSYYKDDAKKREKINELRNDLMFIKKLPPFAAVNYLLKKLHLYDDFKMNYKKNRSGNYELFELMHELKERCKEFDTIIGLLNYVEEVSSQKDCNNTQEKDISLDMVTLQTVHASKGLEYKAVVIIGLMEGIFPHKRSLDREGIKEERRLMYVAMTRAKERLVITTRGTKHGKCISRFISEMSN